VIFLKQFFGIRHLPAPSYLYSLLMKVWNSVFETHHIFFNYKYTSLKSNLKMSVRTPTSCKVNPQNNWCWEHLMIWVIILCL